MQRGDLETQSVVDLAAAVEKTKDPAAVESLQTGVVAPCPSDTATVEVKVTAKATLPPSRRQRLTSGIGTLWRQLREQRREAAAVVVLIVMAMFWFDTGKSGTGAATNSPDPLDTYDAVLSDFEPVGSTQPMRESADPFESGAQNSFDTDLYFPPTERSAASDTVSAIDASANFGESKSATSAHDPDNALAGSASTTYASAEDGSDQQQQQRRKVKFAGQIKPAN